MTHTVEQLQSHIKGLSAQLEASKQIINEANQVNLTLRTNIILYQQSYEEAIKETKALQAEVAELIKKVNDLGVDQDNKAKDKPKVA